MPTRLDPSRTTLLRRSLIVEMRKRFREIKKVIRELLIAEDAFGLGSTVPFTFNVEHPGRFRFQTDAQKLESFRQWLQGQVDQKILTTDALGAPWTGKFVDSAYRKGRIRAFIDARGLAAQESLDFFEGTKEEFLRAAFAQPETIAKVRMLATRSFEELRGVTAAMGQQLNRELSNGLVQGQSPRTIARNMTRRIDGLSKKRAEVIARTEIIHAHAEGQLDSFVDLGVKEVGIKAEWITAGDSRVCPRCAANEGEVFTVKEARGLIPLHPNCRCAWIPAI